MVRRFKVTDWDLDFGAVGVLPDFYPQVFIPVLKAFLNRMFIIA